MDDMCSSWNWRKTCGLSELLRARMERALEDAIAQTKIFTHFTEAIEAEEPTRVAQARAAIRTWEQDAEKKDGTPCPYYYESEGELLVNQYRVGDLLSRVIVVLPPIDVKLQAELAQGLPSDPSRPSDDEDAAALADFIMRGFKIENDRARYSTKRQSDSGTSEQVTDKTQELDRIAQSIRRFRKAQEYHMPAVYASLTSEERNPERKTALTTKLFLPSDPPDHDVSLTTATTRAMEARLRWQEMIRELDILRHQLRLKGCLNRFKAFNITGQRDNTRAREAQDVVNAYVQKAANAYRRHRDAYEALEGRGDWQKTMRKLKNADCRGLGDRLIEQMEQMSESNVQKFLAGRREADTSGETRYELPWFWYNQSEEAGIQITDELMVEWCKCRARAQHIVQEVRLLDEEMRRIVEFSTNMAKQWQERCAPKDRMDFGAKHAYATDLGWEDGVRAYALKQAWIRRSQAAKWHAECVGHRALAQRFLALHTTEGLSVDAPDVPAWTHTEKALINDTGISEPSSVRALDIPSQDTYGVPTVTRHAKRRQ
ncbi:unnamed protein product [Peniophora sp. CBMAI 1063]|nr:unnamed protein product [Peniophora sp. CBMAI 1063]